LGGSLVNQSVFFAKLINFYLAVARVVNGFIFFFKI
jgi:hypothetical protein